MSVQKLEKEFSDFCSQISERELERNPEIKRELGAIRRMIANVRNRIKHRDRKKRDAARQALVFFR